MANKINLMINEIFKKTQKTRNMLKQESEYKQTVDDFVEKLKDIREILADNIDENNGDHQPAKEQLDLLKEIEEDIDIMSEGKTKIIKKYDELIDEKLLNSDITYDSLEINLKDKLLQVIEDQREDKDKIVKQEEILNTIDRRELTIYKNDKKKIVVLDDKGNTINRKRTMIRTNDGDIKPLNMQINNGEINFKKQRKLTEIRIDQFSYNPQENLQSKDIENLSQIDQLRMLDDHMNFKHYTKVVNYKNKFNDGINRDFFTLMYNYSELDEKDFKNLESMKDLKLSGISNLNTNLIKLGNAKEFISGGEHDIRLKPEYIYFKKVSGRPEWRKVLYDKNKNINWRRTFQDINDFYTFIGFSGNLYIDNELKQKQFKMIHDSGPGVIKDIQYNGSNKKIELNDFGFNKKMITLNTVFNGQIQNAKDILQDFGYKNEVVDINKTLFFDLETTGSGKVIEYGFSVSNTGKKFSIINTNVTEKELKEIQGTTQLKNYKELHDIIQSLQNTTDDYIEKDGVVYYKQSSDFDQIFERASKKLGFEKNKLNTLGGYNIKNFDIPLLQEMLESKQIKSNLLTDMVKRQTIDVYDDGYIAYMLKRKGINVQSQSQEQIQSVLKLGESKKHLGQFDQSTTQQIADYLQTNIGGIKTNKKLVELEQNIINQKNPLRILQNRFDKNKQLNILEQATKKTEEEAIEYMKSFNINLNDEEYDLFKSHIYRRVKKTINGYDLMISGNDITKNVKKSHFEPLNLQEELKKHLNVKILQNENIKIDLEKGVFNFIGDQYKDKNTPFFKQQNILNINENLSSLNQRFLSNEYQNFVNKQNGSFKSKTKYSVFGSPLPMRDVNNKKKLLEKGLQFEIEIEKLQKPKKIAKPNKSIYYNIEEQYKEVGLHEEFKNKFYKGINFDYDKLSQLNSVFDYYYKDNENVKNVQEYDINTKIKYVKKQYQQQEKLHDFYDNFFLSFVPDYEKIQKYEDVIKKSYLLDSLDLENYEKNRGNIYEKSFNKYNKNAIDYIDSIDPIDQKELNFLQENKDGTVKKLFKNKRKVKMKVRKMKKSKKNGIVKLKSTIRRINYTESNDKNVSINTETSETKINKVSDFFNKKFNKSDDKKKITKTTVNKKRTVKVKSKAKNFLDTLDQIYKKRIYNQEKRFYEYEFDNLEDKDNPVENIVQNIYKKKKVIEYRQNFLGLGELGYDVQKNQQNILNERLGINDADNFSSYYNRLLNIQKIETEKQFGINYRYMEDVDPDKVIQEFESNFNRLQKQKYFSMLEGGKTSSEIISAANKDVFENSMKKFSNIFSVFNTQNYITVEKIGGNIAEKTINESIPGILDENKDIINTAKSEILNERKDIIRKYYNIQSTIKHRNSYIDKSYNRFISNYIGLKNELSKAERMFERFKNKEYLQYISEVKEKIEKQEKKIYDQTNHSIDEIRFNKTLRRKYKREIQKRVSSTKYHQKVLKLERKIENFFFSESISDTNIKDMGQSNQWYKTSINKLFNNNFDSVIQKYYQNEDLIYENEQKLKDVKTDDVLKNKINENINKAKQENDKINGFFKRKYNKTVEEIEELDLDNKINRSTKKEIFMKFQDDKEIKIYRRYEQILNGTVEEFKLNNWLVREMKNKTREERIFEQQTKAKIEEADEVIKFIKNELKAQNAKAKTDEEFDILLKNLYEFYDLLYINTQSEYSYQNIDKFLKFANQNFDYIQSPNKIYSNFIEEQLKIGKNTENIKKYIKNIRNNLNVDDNIGEIIDIFNLDDSIENYKMIHDTIKNNNSFNTVIQEFVHQTAKESENGLGPENFLKYILHPKGFEYERNGGWQISSEEDVALWNYSQQEKIKESEKIKYGEQSEIDELIQSDTQYNEVGIYADEEYVEDISYEKTETKTESSTILQRELEKLRNNKNYISTDDESKRVSILLEEKNQIFIDKIKQDYTFQNFELNNVFTNNKKVQQKFAEIGEDKQMDYFKKFTKNRFDNPTNAKIFLNILRIYANSKDRGEEFYLQKMFDQNEIYLLKGNKPTTTKDFQKTLEAFGNLLKYTKNENNDFVDLSYMISEIMKKQIKPFDFDYLNNKTKKQVMEVKIPFMKLNAKQNDFQRDTLYKISESITGRFENGKLVKNFDQVLREARSITDDMMLKQFDQEDINYYYSKFNNGKKQFNLQQKLIFQMEEQQKLMNKKIFLDLRIAQLSQIKDVNKRNEQLNNFFKKNFSEYYSADEEEILTGRGFLKQQLLDITYNYDDYSKGIDVTSPEYRKQNDNIKKSKKIIKQLIDSLEYENELDKEIKKKQDKKAIKNLDSNTHNKNYQSKIGKTQINKSKQVDDGQKDITNEVKKMLDSETKQFDSGFKKMINYFQNNKKGKIGLTITQSAIVGQSILGQKQKQKQEAKAQTLYGQQKQGSYEIEEVQFLGRPQYGVDLYQPTYYEDLVDDVIQSHSETYNYDERLVNLYDGRLQKMATTGGDPYEEQSGY